MCMSECMRDNVVGFSHNVVCLSDFKVVYFSDNVVSCACLSACVIMWWALVIMLYA